MARTTGATAVAERPTDALWLAALPRLTSTVDRLPVSTRPQAEAAEGAVSGLPGAVTDMAVSADGRSLVLALYGHDMVCAVDTGTLTVTGVVADVAEPFALSVADRAYVTSAANSGDSLVAVDLDFSVALAERAMNTSARGLAVTPAGDIAYVARCGDDVADIVAVEVVSGRMTVIPVARGAGVTVDAVRLSADGKRLYATLRTDAGSALAVVDTRARKVVQTIAVDGTIGDIAVHRDGRRIFATCWDDEIGGVLTVIDAGAGRVVDTLAVSGLPTQVVLTGTRAYVLTGDQISVFDTATGGFVDTIEIGWPVSCLAVNFAGTRLYIADFEGSVVARAVSAAGPRLRAAS
jgi:DNA-binding beta-propeller fold protein YncE